MLINILKYCFPGDNDFVQNNPKIILLFIYFYLLVSDID